MTPLFHRTTCFFASDILKLKWEEKNFSFRKMSSLVLPKESFCQKGESDDSSLWLAEADGI